MADTRTLWRQRVAEWRASGQTAEAYSVGRGFAASSLRWWSSKLGREQVVEAPSGPVVRFAQLLRSPSVDQEDGAIIVEMRDVGVRVTVAAGADGETVARIVEVMLRRGTK